MDAGFAAEAERSCELRVGLEPIAVPHVQSTTRSIGARIRAAAESTTTFDRANRISSPSVALLETKLDAESTVPTTSASTRGSDATSYALT